MMFLNILLDMFSINSRMSGVKNILVFNPSFIGDAILTTPLINALRKLSPDTRITFCIRPDSAPILNNLDFDVLIFDKRGKNKGITGFYRFLKTLREKKFDLVISPHKSFRSSLLLLLSAIPLKIGFAQSSGAFIYSHTVSRDISLHEVERNLSLLSPIIDDFSLQNAKQAGGKPVTYLDKEYAEISGTFMQAATENAPLIGINAGSVWPTKRWPAERYAALASKLRDAGIALAIFGGPGDEEVNNRLRKLITFEYFDYANKVEFSKIPALIKNMTLLISNDSSPMHLAVSQNTPVLAIFGPTAPALGFAPYDDESVVCEVEGLYCRPCSLHGGKKCPEKHFRCMLELPVERVYKTAMEMMEKA